MTWKEIQPADVQPGDYIDVNGNLTELVEVDGLTGYAELDDWKHQIPLPLAALFGAKFKREIEDHPHGLIPTGHGVVIRIDELVYERCGQRWLEAGIDGSFSHEIVQGRADLHGYTVLWPKQPAEITDEMVERGAEALWKHHGDDDSNLTRWAYEDEVTAVLEAALGGDE